METAKTKLFVGKSGFGKSYILGWEVEQYYSKGYTPVIIDKKNDHDGLGEDLGFKKFEVGSKSIDYYGAKKLKALISKLIDNGVEGIIFTFPNGDPSISQRDYITFANNLSNALLSIDEPIYFGLEEIRNFAPSQSNDADFHALQTVIVEGRSQDKIFGGTLQFPQQVHFKVFQAVNIYKIFGLGTDDNAYDKLSIKGKEREKMKNWSKDERKYLNIDENEGTKDFRSSADITRKTRHSG